MKIIQSRSGLYFVIDDEKYEDLNHLIIRLNEEIVSKNMIDIKIEWFWDFKGNDVIDTMNGRLLDTYYFEIALIPYG